MVGPPYSVKILPFSNTFSRPCNKEQMLFENEKHEVYTVNKYKIDSPKQRHDKSIVQADEVITLNMGYVALSVERL